MTKQEMIDKLVLNVPNMTKHSFTHYFGSPGVGPHTMVDLQNFARKQLEAQSEGEHIRNIEIIYADAEGNDELLF